MNDDWPILRQPHGDDLEAAFQDISKVLSGRRREPRLALRAQSHLEPASAVVTVLVRGPRGGRAVHLRRSPILRAMREGLDPLRLIAAAQASRIDLDDDGIPARDTVPDVTTTIEELLPLYRITSADSRIDNALRQGQDVLLVGKHGSGKSATVAARAERFLADGGGVLWLDLTSPAVGAHTVYHRFLCAARMEAYLVVVDGAQANIPVLKEIFTAALEMRHRYGVRLTILATGLTTLVERLPEVFRDFQHVLARPGEIIEALIRPMRLDPPDQKRVRELADDDLMIARMIVAFHERNHRIPTRRDLEDEHTGGIEDSGLRKALYWFACLGYFQIDVPGATARRRFAGPVLDTLLERSLIVDNNGQYSAGPRSRAGLVLRHALREWDTGELGGRPADLAWNYLQVAGEPAMRATLDRLDLIGASAGATGAVDTSTRYLLAAWDRVNQLERRLIRMCTDDPTWRGNAGAAIFAAMAMARMRREDSWSRVAVYIRKVWRYDDSGELPRAVPGPTSEREDFPMIQSAMAAEDQTLGRPAAKVETAEEIDVDRFHRSWMLGMLLGFEGAALQDGHDRVRKLRHIADRHQHPDGFFYPRRVPWVTARIILGLCSTGLNYETSATVKLACDWLLRPVSQAGAHNNSWWRSGTGNWNRQEATTAMCLAALLRADAPIGPQPTAMAWLWSEEHQREWRQEGREIDLALVIEATSMDPERWRDAYPLVRDLLQWVLGALDDPPEGSDVNEGGLRLPFVTLELITFVWQSVIREFSVLLADMVQLNPETGDTAVVLDDPGRRRWLHRVGVLRDRIQHELRERDRLRAARPPDDPQNRAIQHQVDRLRADQTAAAGFEERLRTSASEELLDEINEMGQRICGVEWPEL